MFRQFIDTMYPPLTNEDRGRLETLEYLPGMPVVVYIHEDKLHIHRPCVHERLALFDSTVDRVTVLTERQPNVRMPKHEALHILERWEGPVLQVRAESLETFDLGHTSVSSVGMPRQYTNWWIGLRHATECVMLLESRGYTVNSVERVTVTPIDITPVRQAMQQSQRDRRDVEEMFDGPSPVVTPSPPRTR